MKKKTIVIIILVCTIVLALLCAIIVIRHKSNEQKPTVVNHAIENTNMGENEENNIENENLADSLDIDTEEDVLENTEIEIHSGSGVVTDIDPQDTSWFKKVLFLVNRAHNPYGVIEESSILEEISSIEVYKTHNGTTDIYINFEDNKIDNITMSQFDTSSDVSYMYMERVSSTAKNKVTAEKECLTIDKDIIMQYVDAMKNNYYISDYSFSDTNITVDKTKVENSYFSSLLNLPSNHRIKKENNILENILWVNGIDGCLKENNISINDINNIEIYYNSTSQIAVFKCIKESGEFTLVYNTYASENENINNLLVLYYITDNNKLQCVEANTTLLGTVENPSKLIENKSFISITEILKGE